MFNGKVKPKSNLSAFFLYSLQNMSQFHRFHNFIHVQHGCCSQYIYFATIFNDSQPKWVLLEQQKWLSVVTRWVVLETLTQEAKILRKEMRLNNWVKQTKMPSFIFWKVKIENVKKGRKSMHSHLSPTFQNAFFLSGRYVSAFLEPVRVVDCGKNAFLFNQKRNKSLCWPVEDCLMDIRGVPSKQGGSWLPGQKVL